MRPLRQYTLRAMSADLLLAGVWLGVCVLVGTLVAYRALLHSSIADLLDFRDVPLLWLLKSRYREAFLLLLATHGLFVTLAFVNVLGRVGTSATADSANARFETLWAQPGRAIFLGSVLLHFGLSVWANRFAWETGSGTTGFATGQQPTGIADWAIGALTLLTGWLMSTSTAQRLAASAAMPDRTCAPEAIGEAGQGESDGAGIGVVSLASVYLLGLAGIVAYGLVDHLTFWDSARNGGFDFERFFADGEKQTANLVMISTTVLFASLAAVTGCLAFLAFGMLSRSRRVTGHAVPQQIRTCTVLITAGWTLIGGVPWETRLLTEIRAERGWILPAIVLSSLAGALLPLVSITVTALMDEALASRRDLQRQGSRGLRLSRILLFGSVLFAIYPILRPILPRRSAIWQPLLLVLSVGLIATSVAGVNFVDEWFEFEDWRGMLRQAQLPALLVYCSLLASFAFYVLLQQASEMLTTRASSWPSRWPLLARLNTVGRNAGTLLVAGAATCCLLLASFPFWGWRDLPENVFARLSEFHGRHRFERSTLQAIFDLDRDGYAAVLHGADADDCDPRIQAGGLPASETVALPLDHFTVCNADRAAEPPNVLVLYLEGVIPRALSCYGERRLPDHLVATPHIDSVAADGTLFTQARVYYPSTWDAWFAVNSGRFLHISEMNNSVSFGRRYSRYNNLYRALQLTGIDRWCHADSSCYAELFVPEAIAGEHPAWEAFRRESTTSLSTEEIEADVWSGDKRNERILRFLDDLQPGERFFLCEHMSDSHFPWRKTSRERARELGFEDGLGPYSSDAQLPWTGTFNRRYARYLETVTRVDWQIGQILQKLKERDLYDETLIVIMSDHGCQWWEHEHLYYVSHLYEQCLRVPLIIRAPEGCRGRRFDGPVLQTDILPTILELCGLKHDLARSGPPLPGLSLVPVLEGRADSRLREQLRRRDVPLMTHYDTIGLLADFRYKLIFDRVAGTWWLFDLQQDPREMHNLADADPALLRSLQERLRDYVTSHPEFLGELQRPAPGSEP